MLPRRSSLSSKSWLLLPALLAGLAAHAQMHHVDAPERVTRAVGVYEWTGDLHQPKAARLVPVSLFIDGRLQDAATFLARPIPLALEPGNVYSIEKAGEPEGLFDLVSARQLSIPGGADTDAAITWLGSGRVEHPPAAKKSTLEHTATVSHITSSASPADDDRPHFVPSRPETSGSPAQPASGGRSTPAATSSTDDDSERPTLGRRSSTDTTDAGKKPKKEKPQSYVSGMPSGLNDDPDRPTMRRGPVHSTDTDTLTGLPANLHQAVAVSDPSKPEPHVFARSWESSAERASTLAALEKLASARVREYLSTNQLEPGPAPAAAAAEPAAEDAAPPTLKRTPHGVSTRTGPPTPASPRRTVRSSRPAPLPSSLQLTGTQLQAFELSYGGLPTFVYSAELPARPAAVRSASATVYITLVAQRLPSGELQVALSSITDSGHLNRDPWMRFVDAVDADGSHRASLLFEQRSTRTRQFALYRLISSTAEQTFTTAPLP